MPAANLTRAEASARADLLDVASYDVELDVTTGRETFGTRTTLRFAAREGASTFVDLLDADVARIVLNDRQLDPDEHYDGSRIALTGLAADNTLTVVAHGRYTNTGEGLHRFVDPVDDEVYLYSQFEVCDARRVFAVFDQPDLKATFRFAVVAPADWVVVSNEPADDPEEIGPADSDPSLARRRWTFAPTGRLASYVTAVCAGPYQGVHDEVSSRGGVVPLGIYSRKSLAPHLDADNLFEVTRQGFAFFEEEFDCAYPFTKYDQVFCPEYNMGAMENAGCVTITEAYLFTSKVSEAYVERRALTVLHELAHMWFGDLVTMRWWDDLWLNESFAEWAANAAQAEATAWSSAWTTFTVWEKAKAYHEDQRSTTHPIVADIRDVHDVEVNFDGITYAKGASVLKQLVAYVGRDSFRAGLRSYFATHAWGNTTLPDLLHELEAASGRDLADWSRLWLTTAGVNELTPRVTVGEDGLIASAAVEQSAPAELPTLRPHRLGIGRYDVRDGSLVRVGYHELDVDGRVTDVPELVGLPRPDLLLLNDDDLAYAKVSLDERSLATARLHVRDFTDGMPRALVLAAAWEMTSDATMPARTYVDLSLAALDGERDSTQIRRLLTQLRDAARLYAAPAHRDALLGTVADRLRDLAVNAPPGSDSQLQLVTAFGTYARRPEDRDWLAGLYDGSQTLPGLGLDTEMRWALLTSLVGAGGAGAAEIEDRLDLDRTSTGQERAARAHAAVPTAEAKAMAWKQAVEDGGVANQTVEALAAGFTACHDTALLEPYVQRYHEALLDLAATRTYHILEDVVEGFYPLRLADRRLLDATQGWLDAHPDASGQLRRMVASHRDDLVRALAAQECDAAG